MTKGDNKNLKIKNVLLTVYHKEPALPLIKELHKLGVTFYSTGGTLKFLEKNDIPAVSIESVTSYPSIFDGRVKTLHPKVFGGILSKKSEESHIEELKKYEIPEIDMVIVDLYPFEETLISGGSFEDLIEKIDIGGISLIRAAAKNFNDVWTVPSSKNYKECVEIINSQNGSISYEQRKSFAAKAFDVSSHYDIMIYNFLSEEQPESFKASIPESNVLRYGENPHQKGVFYGDINKIFNKIQGKSLSYNNLLDIESALGLINEFEEPTFAIIKHNNACGVASSNNITDAYKKALSSNPIAAFGGILIANRNITEDCAYCINKLFFEVIIAPGYNSKAIEILSSKEKRIILELKDKEFGNKQYRSLLNGVLEQDKDKSLKTENDWDFVTKLKPSKIESEDLIFANKIVKHTKSNAIILAKDKHLLGSGTGQTSRVDALKQAIEKAKEFGFDLNGAVMASDAFFPFPDCAEIAHKEGITSIIQPGGSIRDEESIKFCNNNKMSMIFTKLRHFKH